MQSIRREAISGMGSITAWHLVRLTAEGGPRATVTGQTSECAQERLTVKGVDRRSSASTNPPAWVGGVGGRGAVGSGLGGVQGVTRVGFCAMNVGLGGGEG